MVTDLMSKKFEREALLARVQWVGSRLGILQKLDFGPMEAGCSSVNQASGPARRLTMATFFPVLTTTFPSMLCLHPGCWNLVLPSRSQGHVMGFELCRQNWKQRLISSVKQLVGCPWKATFFLSTGWLHSLFEVLLLLLFLIVLSPPAAH